MRVIICDDQAIIRDGLELLLKLDPDIVVVGKACNGAEAIDLLVSHQTDLVLMDLKMPVMNGIEATAAHPRSLSRRQSAGLNDFRGRRVVVRRAAGRRVRLLVEGHAPERSHCSH